MGIWDENDAVTANRIVFNKKMLHEHRTYTHAVCVRQIEMREMREIKKKTLYNQR